jgi:Flp pilus assembly protein protease CpaA
MIEGIILIISFAYLLLTSILDIKYRLVWDYINYSFGFLFLTIRILELIITANLTVFLGVMLASLATFIIGLILYKIGAWGGGDLKLLTALSIGLFFLPSDKLIVQSLSFPFYANFLINTLFSGIIFGLAWSYYLLIKSKAYREFKKAHILIILSALILIVLAFFVQPKEKALFSLLAVFCLYYIIKIFENKITVIEKDIKKLDEGDWLAKDIKLNNKITITNSKDYSSNQVMALKNDSMKRWGKNPIFRLFIGIYYFPPIFMLFHKNAPGLSKEDIKILQSSRLKRIKIKDGIPFLVSFFLAFIITVLLNNNLISIIVINL